ncbi:MAG TPA: hypothetical protein VL944_00880 [Candidatus Acidoferrum sp.]|nr:hypothetical protein [Candidatus Acidoferrum sp.]
MAARARVARRKRVHRKRMPVRRPPKRQRLHDEYVASSEEALVSRILEHRDQRGVPEDSILLISLLSNLTPSMVEVSRRAGIRTGRHLFSAMNSQKRYIFYEESIEDLIRFFEHAGYRNVSYNVFPDMVRVQMHDKCHEYLGVNLHSFEAGLMSGYITAAKKQYVNISEHDCSNNGSDYCDFMPGYGSGKSGDAKGAIERFVWHIVRQSEGREKNAETTISPAYFLLSASPTMEKEYQREMQHIGRYIGEKIGEGLFQGRRKQSPAHAMAKIERVARLLNIGEVTVKSLNPIKVDVLFDRSHSRSEFVDLSIALLGGLLKEYLNEGTKISREARKSAYMVKIAGKPT